MKLALFAAVILLPAALSAQEFRGTLSGSVTDPQGAPVPKAKVVAIQKGTGAKSETFSEASGEYTIPFLMPGEYEIETEVAGFKRYVREGITLSAGEHPVIDIRLEVGGVNEAISVTADAPLVVSANPSVGQIITSEEVEDLPVNGRSPMMLATLAMGVTNTTEPGPTRPFDFVGSTFSVGGTATGSNEMLLNGAPNGAAAAWGPQAYSPPQDAVMEVRVSIFENDAAYGHAAGGTFNQVTKGGTNGFHGSAYDFNQVSLLDANPFYTNKAGEARPAYHYNQFGFSAGAPVFIPKVFNGKNRIFWFFAYEGLKDSDPSTSPIEGSNPLVYATVPTAAERSGDFSALLPLSTSGTSYVLYDPATGVVSGSHVSRTPFVNNIIPQSRLNPVALNLLKYFPLPNTAGLANGQQNYVVDTIDSDGYDNEMGRLDINFSDRNKLSIDARHNYRSQQKNNYFDNISQGNTLWRVNQGTGIDDVYTISPTTVVDVRASWMRYIQILGSPSDGYNPTSLGFPSSIASNAEALQLPYIVFTSATIAAGGTSSYQPLGYNGDGSNTYDVFQIFGDIAKFRGNHSFKVGADVREYRWSAYTHGNPSGTFTFNQDWTNGPLNNATAAPIGQDLAAFLLGLPYSGSIDLNAQSTATTKYMAFFVQDDWRARANLTLNFGLRWEHEIPATERYDRAVNGFDPAAVNPVSAAAASAYAKSPNALLPASQFNALGGLTFASSSNPYVYNTRSYIFSPRAGFAWTPTLLGRGTVIRAGIGVFVSPIEPVVNNSGATSSTGLNQEGFSQTTQFTATNNNYLSPAATLSNPFPNGILAQGSTIGSGTFLGQQLTIFNPEVRNPYSIRWDLSLQRQLPGQMVLEVAYVGSHSLHLPVTTQLDYLPRQYLATTPTRNTTVVNQITASVANPFQGLLPNSTSENGSTVQLDQLLLPYPQYPFPSPPASPSNGIVMQGNGAGSSYYESLNVRLQKRLTHGLTVIQNFAWSAMIERIAYLNDSDPAPEKRVSGDSRPLRETLAATYEFPVGRGRRFDLHSRIGNGVLGGWALNGSLALQSGPPLSWGNVIYLGGPLNFDPHQPNGDTFDLTRFNSVSAQQLEYNVRNFDTYFNNLRRDSTKNLDLSMAKRFVLGERKYLQVRFEAFNATNRVTFGAPQLSPTNAAFGLISTQANTPRRVQTGLRLVW
jgi:hypothetical protein